MEYFMLFARTLLIPATLAFTLAACGGDGSNHSPAPAEETRPALDLSFGEAPIALPGITANFAADVSYGDAERNLFDIYLPDCDEPTPLVIFIHGGGFTGGDKSSAHENFADDIREFLQSCVAYATISYTLLDVPEEGGDLEAAAADQKLWEVGGSHAIIREHEGIFEVLMLDTTPDEALDSIKALIDLADDRGAQRFSAWVADCDWLVTALEDSGCTTEPSGIYAQPL